VQVLPDEAKLLHKLYQFLYKNFLATEIFILDGLNLMLQSINQFMFAWALGM